MSSTSDILKDLFTGCCSGWGQVLTMMPFENIKVFSYHIKKRLKSSQNHNNTRDTLMPLKKQSLMKDIQDFTKAC